MKLQLGGIVRLAFRLVRQWNTTDWVREGRGSRSISFSHETKLIVNVHQITHLLPACEATARSRTGRWPFEQEWSQYIDRQSLQHHRRAMKLPEFDTRYWLSRGTVGTSKNQEMEPHKYQHHVHHMEVSISQYPCACLQYPCDRNIIFFALPFQVPFCH